MNLKYIIKIDNS